MGFLLHILIFRNNEKQNMNESKQVNTLWFIIILFMLSSYPGWKSGIILLRNGPVFWGGMFLQRVQYPILKIMGRATSQPFRIQTITSFEMSDNFAQVGQKKQRSKSDLYLALPLYFIALPPHFATQLPEGGTLLATQPVKGPKWTPNYIHPLKLT